MIEQQISDALASQSLSLPSANLRSGLPDARWDVERLSVS
jgi:hypothetical protein